MGKSFNDKKKIYALKAIPTGKCETTARYTVAKCINLMNCFRIP